jgi:hypothetical protein
MADPRPAHGCRRCTIWIVHSAYPEAAGFFHPIPNDAQQLDSGVFAPAFRMTASLRRAVAGMVTDNVRYGSRCGSRVMSIAAAIT